MIDNNQPYYRKKKNTQVIRLKQEIALYKKKLEQAEINYDVITEDVTHLKNKVHILGSKYFDEKYYRQQVEDFDDSENDILDHYLKVGSEKGLNPSKHFDTKYYLEVYPDVALTEMHPLVHFVKFGAAEGRLSKPVNLSQVLRIYTNDIFRRPQIYLGKVPRLWMSLRINGPVALFKQLKDKVARSTSSIVDYKQWIEKCDTLSEKDLQEIKKHCRVFDYKPKISILMPTYNTPEAFLRKAIESVQAQLYDNWELCIADDASTKKHVKQVLDEYQVSDDRIKIVYRAENQHISATSNSALEIATGDYITLLDHDDELSVHALYYVVNALNDNPDALLIYSDEDKIDEIQGRHEPYFKPDWNPDLLLSQNYISHLGVYQRQRTIDIGGFRVGFEGSQDYDLVLRFVSGLKETQIEHIPHILYHWRKHDESTALDEYQKNYAYDAGLKAVQQYLDKEYAEKSELERPDSSWEKSKPALAELIPHWGTMFRIKYGLPEKLPLVSVIIPTKNNRLILSRCLESLSEKTSYDNIEILVIDNQSDDQDCLDYLDSIHGKQSVRVIKYDKPFNYSAINNFSVRHAIGDVICLLNDDTEVITQNWLSEMVSHALRPEIGVVGAKLLYPDNTIQHAGVITGLGGVAGHGHKYAEANDKGYFCRAGLVQNYSVVTAACVIVKKETYLRVGGLDEMNLKIAFNDVDFCLRVRELGFKNLWTPFVELFHHESKSRGHENTPEKIARFQEEIYYMQSRWGNMLRFDPAYNPNLSLGSEQWRISDEPRIEKPWLSI